MEIFIRLLVICIHWSTHWISMNAFVHQLRMWGFIFLYKASVDVTTDYSHTTSVNGADGMRISVKKQRNAGLKKTETKERLTSTRCRRTACHRRSGPHSSAIAVWHKQEKSFAFKWAVIKSWQCDESVIGWRRESHLIGSSLWSISEWALIILL